MKHNTTFQIGVIWIKKDLVFGWCLRDTREEKVEWVPLADIDIDFLRAFKSKYWPFPAFIPEEFNAAFLKTCEQPLKIELGAQERTAVVKPSKSHTRQHGYPYRQVNLSVEHPITIPADDNAQVLSNHREADKAKLAEQIRNGEVDSTEGSLIFVSRLVYGMVTCDKNTVWSFHDRRGEKEFSGGLDDLYDHVLRRYW